MFFPNSRQFWEGRYALGGHSGGGSYGLLAEFKAEILNGFVARHAIQSVVEFGCGDGAQLSLADYPKYTGLDVASTAVSLCSDRFANDPSKNFLLYDADSFDPASLRADLALSLDVIYHLVEDAVYEGYLDHLFATAERFVIVYSSNHDERGAWFERHIRHRPVTRDILARFPDWRLLEEIPNRYPWNGNSAEGSFANFYIFQKSGEASVTLDP